MFTWDKIFASCASHKRLVSCIINVHRQYIFSYYHCSTLLPYYHIVPALLFLLWLIFQSDQRFRCFVPFPTRIPSSLNISLCCYSLHVNYRLIKHGISGHPFVGKVSFLSKQVKSQFFCPFNFNWLSHMHVIGLVHIWGWIPFQYISLITQNFCEQVEWFKQ